jgi:hypothetical protein
MILVFGILSLVLFLVGSLCCFPLPLVGLIMGIVAWVLAVPDLKEMDSGIMDPTGRGATKAGMICGIVCCALTLLAILAVGAVFLIALLQDL